MRFIQTDKNNRVVRTGTDSLGRIPEGCIESNLGELGQIMNEDGTFSDYIPTEQEQQEQLNQQEITELNNWLDLRRNIEHPDKAAKQARLLELLA